MVQKFCHWSFIWMTTWMEDNGIFPSHNAVKLYQVTNHWNWIELNWIELEGAHLKLMPCYMWTVLTALYYLKTRDTSMFPVLLLQKGSYDRICPQIRKLEWMIHTVPLKSKLTVTRVLILETRFSRVDSRFSKLLRMESRITMIKDRVSMFVSGNIMTFSWECTC